MPYGSIAELPDAVKSAYSTRCQRVFMEAFNGAKGGESSKFAQAHTAAKNCETATSRPGKALVPVKATVVDDDRFRLLAFPFGGPIPSPYNKAGADVDGQWYDPAVDIRPDWLPVRLVDWHHGGDPLLRRTVLGKAILDPEPDEDGWWVDVWLRHGERRLDLIRRLAERGGQLFGSSESVPGIPKMRTPDGQTVAWKAKTPGAITYWPYLRQTLSTSPQNTHSVLRPMKAQLDDYAAEGIAPDATFFDDLARYLDDLATGPVSDLSADGELAAKAGRVLAARNEARLRNALAELAGVLEELDRYLPPEEKETA